MTVAPFTIAVPEPVLDNIVSRLRTSVVGYAPADDADWRYGTDARYLAEVLDYWRDVYDWRAAERALNEWPHFTAHIDDATVHFIHVRASTPGRQLPLILTHGWPGSFIEFLEVIPLLVEQGFDVVVPSLPGYGFSSRPSVPTTPRRIAALWRRLMVDELGYKRFGAQGGDWGSSVSSWLGCDHPDVVAAIHLNLFDGPPPSGEDDEATVDWRARRVDVFNRESGYAHEHRSKPQTIGLALADSPVGFASWVLEKFYTWGDTNGDIESRFSKDQLLTNIMIYLVNDAVQSAIWLYRSLITESRDDMRVDLPTGLAVFPAEFSLPAPRSCAARKYNIQRWTTMASGGHFAAMEEPRAFAADVAAFFSGHAVT
jgi:microsomal epoxide hydrolase